MTNRLTMDLNREMIKERIARAQSPRRRRR